MSGDVLVHILIPSGLNPVSPGQFWCFPAVFLGFSGLYWVFWFPGWSGWNLESSAPGEYQPLWPPDPDEGSTTGHLWWSLMGGEVTNMCHILRGRCEPWWQPQSSVLGDLVSFQNLRSFPVFLCITWFSCTACTVVFQFLEVWVQWVSWWSIGDPMLIPSLPSEAVLVLPPGPFWSESEGTVAVSWWSARWSNVDSLLTWHSGSVLLWVVFAAFGSFSLLLAVFLGGLDVPGVLGFNLEDSGHSWACLNVSRSFGLRHMLAGHPSSCRVGLTHNGSQIDVVEVREQLGGQGRLCIEVCCYMGWVVPPNHPLVGGIPCFPWVE